MTQYTITIVNNSSTAPTVVVFQKPPEASAGGEALQAPQGAQATIDFAVKSGTAATVTQGADGAWTLSYG